MSDDRQFSIIPFRALLDERLGLADLAVLAALGGHTNAQGFCHPSPETVGRLARLKERAVRNAFRTLESCGWIRTWREKGMLHYQVLFDVAESQVGAEFERAEDRHADAGVTTEKRHRHVGAGGDDRHPDAGPAPACRTDRHPGADGTGTSVPGERSTEREQPTTTAEARASAPEGEPQKATATGDTGDISAKAITLTAAANRALMQNPKMPRTALEPLTAGLATGPLTEWLRDEIPFELILETVKAVAGKYAPANVRSRISSFVYFDAPVRDAWAKAQARADAAVAPAGVAGETRLGTAGRRPSLADGLMASQTAR